MSMQPHLPTNSLFHARLRPNVLEEEAHRVQLGHMETRRYQANRDQF